MKGEIELYLETVITQGILRIKATGELDMAVANSFRQQVEDMMNQAMANDIILNLQDVAFIDSSGLGVILGRYKRVSAMGGKMAIVAPQPQVRRILELSGIMKIIEEYSTDEAAIQAVKGGRTIA